LKKWNCWSVRIRNPASSSASAIVRSSSEGHMSGGHAERSVTVFSPAPAPPWRVGSDVAVHQQALGPVAGVKGTDACSFG
jgi:hypothetical protein